MELSAAAECSWRREGRERGKEDVRTAGSSSSSFSKKQKQVICVCVALQLTKIDRS